MSELTGRRRCAIPEHRKQIRAMQRWCAFLQAGRAAMWSQLRAECAEHEVTRHRLRELQRRFDEATSPQVGTK